MQGYGLTQKDRDGLRKFILEVRAGKGVPSRRPVPTRRRDHGGGRASGITTVAITADIDPATIVSGDLVPAVTNVTKLERDVDGNYSPGDSIEIENHLPDRVTIPENKFKVGYCHPAVDDTSVMVLFQASCTTFDVPEEWV